MSALIKKLKEPFPKEAMTIDSSRGFALTSIKAQWVVERLNDVFGVLNWEFVPKFEQSEKGVLCHGLLRVWTNEGQERCVRNTGFSLIKKNLGDSFKSASTDCLCKCSSYLCIGNDVFKGLVKEDDLIDLESYVIKVGKNKGKKLSDMKEADLLAFINWVDMQKAQGENMHQSVLDTADKMAKYMEI